MLGDVVLKEYDGVYIASLSLSDATWFVSEQRSTDRGGGNKDGSKRPVWRGARALKKCVSGEWEDDVPVGRPHREKWAQDLSWAAETRF